MSRTTSAPSRRPRSSGSEARAGVRCANCGAALGGPYCAGCGQRDLPRDPTARELAVDAAQEMLGVDGKLLSTARMLLRPGRLTADYLAGRRAAHVGPVRIYLATSALLFTVLALQPPDTSPRSRSEFRMFGMARVRVDMSDSIARSLERARNPTLYDRAALRMRAAALAALMVAVLLIG